MIKKILLTFAVILVVLVALAVWYEWTILQTAPTRLTATLATQKRSGDLEAALSTYQDALATSATPDQKAFAILVGSTIPYLLSGSTTDAIQSVQDLKKVAADTSVQPYIRASAIVLLGRWYALSGYNSDVFKEIFKDEPYKKLLVQTGNAGDAADSIRALFYYSRKITPTYAASISIAKSHVTRMYWNQALGLTNKDTNLKYNTARAEFNLQNAEELYQPDSQKQPSYPEAKIAYMSDRAYVVAGLAHFVGAPFIAEYRKAYDDFFMESAKLGSANVNNTLAYVRLIYAMHLIEIDKDTEGARQQLLLAIDSVQKSSDPANNALVVQIRKIKNGTSQELTPVPLEKLTAISPEFKTFVDNIK